MTSEQQLLVTQHHNLIYSIIRKMHVTIDDYYDVAAIGLCEAAIKYQEEKGAFTTFAWNVMKNKIKDVLFQERNKWSRDTFFIPLDLVVAEDDTEITVEDSLTDDISAEDLAIFKLLKETIMRRLSGPEQMVLIGAMNGYTNVEMASRLNVSKARITQIKKNIKKKYKRLQGKM